MASASMVEVALSVRVGVTFQAEEATQQEISVWVQRHQDEASGAILRLLEYGRGEVEAGWLDEDRAVFAVAVVSAEADDNPSDVPVVIG